MSSAGATGGGAAAAALPGDPKGYFCHQCSRTFTLAAGVALACVHCSGDFVEEFDVPSPNTNPDPFRDLDRGSPFYDEDDEVIGGEAISIPHANIRDLVRLLRDVTGPGSRAGGDPSTEPLGAVVAPYSGNGPEPLLSLLQDFIQTVVNGGGDIQLTIDGAGVGGEGGLLGRSIGDYFVGPGLERLIEQLAENDPNRYGTPPAAKTAIEALPDVKISEKQLVSDDAQCSVCMDTFELGAIVKQMPCMHVFHKDCILPWLELHNSCPVCRHELPTDDPDYESRKDCVGGATNSGTTTSTANETAAAAGADAPRRRYNLPYLWPFNRFGSNSEDDSSENGDGHEEPTQASR